MSRACLGKTITFGINTAQQGDAFSYLLAALLKVWNSLDEKVSADPALKDRSEQMAEVALLLTKTVPAPGNMNEMPL